MYTQTFSLKVICSVIQVLTKTSPDHKNKSFINGLYMHFSKKDSSLINIQYFAAEKNDYFKV